MISEIQTEIRMFYHSASTQSNVICTDHNSTTLREGIWSSSQQINHTVFFHNTFTFAYSRCLLMYVNPKEYKAPQLANTRVKKPHFYFATRACEVAEMWSFKHCSGTGLRNYKFPFRGPTSPNLCNIFNLSYGIPAENKLNNRTDKQIMSLLWACFASSTAQNQSRPVHETITATTEQFHSKERGCSRPSLSEKVLLPELPYFF